MQNARGATTCPAFSHRGGDYRRRSWAPSRTCRRSCPRIVSPRGRAPALPIRAKIRHRIFKTRLLLVLNLSDVSRKPRDMFCVFRLFDKVLHVGAKQYARRHTDGNESHPRPIPARKIDAAQTHKHHADSARASAPATRCRVRAAWAGLRSCQSLDHCSCCSEGKEHKQNAAHDTCCANTRERARAPLHAPKRPRRSTASCRPRRPRPAILRGRIGPDLEVRGRVRAIFVASATVAAPLAFRRCQRDARRGGPPAGGERRSIACLPACLPAPPAPAAGTPVGRTGGGVADRL